MNNTIMDEIDIDHLQSLDTSSLLRFVFEAFGQRAAVGTSLQKTGIVTIDLLHNLGVSYRVFFIDTRSNHPETYELLEEVEKRYCITIEKFGPTDQEIKTLYEAFGQYAHFLARSRCCHVRKTVPMQRAMATLDVWVAGLRSDQSQHRRDNAKKVYFTNDSQGRKVLKVNPLLDWTTEQVDQYTREHDLPCNKLYNYISEFNERFTTIGCKECHIPVQEQCDPRTGKFPWERGLKECGIHHDGSGI